MNTKLFLYPFALVFILSSCTNFHHSKTVENRTRDIIVLEAGCCGSEELIKIDPNASKEVFACIYQSHKKPNKNDLSWNISAVDNQELSDKLADPKMWIKSEKGSELDYLFIVKE